MFGSGFVIIQTDKKNATIDFCQVRHVVHKHELTLTRTLSKVSGLFEFIIFCISLNCNH